MVNVANIPPFPDDVPTVDLPVIDFDALKKGDQVEAQRVFEACTGVGFFFLKNHHVDPQFMFDLADATFQLPLEEKMKYAMAEGQYLGYKCAGVHIVDDKGTPDAIETYHISRDDILCTDRTVKPLAHPGPVNEHRAEVEQFIRGSHDIADVTCRVLATQLGLDPEALASRHAIGARSGSHARVTHAPPVNDPNTICLGEHSDFGGITVLFNQLGGLQVLLPGTREWKYVRPRPDLACVNLGDALVKFTGDRLVSGVHRVVAPPGHQVTHPRHSVVYFARPNGDEKLGNLFVDDDDDNDESQSLEAELPTADEWIERRVRGMQAEGFTESQWGQGRGTEHHKDLWLDPKIQPVVTA